MSNPALTEKVFGKISSLESTQPMTIQGTINKTGILVLLMVLGAGIGWNLQSPGIMMASLIINLILAFLVIFSPPRAAFLSQPYAFIEGVLLGSISASYAMVYPGIISNALFLTIGCLMGMLALYRFRIIQVTDRVRSVIMMATFAIAITYLVEIVLGLFGIQVPFMHQNSPAGIVISLVIVGVAAANLLLDFNLIESAAQRNSPKFMEWYGGFALILTLVWLYLEILRLLSKLNRR